MLAPLEMALKIHWVLLSSLLAIAVWGCSGGENREVQPKKALLPRPFTADEIRKEMVPGFELTLQRVTPEGTLLERWNVVSADENGVEIEYTQLGANGTPAAPPVVRSSTWIELRDHANFSAETSSREQVSLYTRLGTLEGWLYTVNDTAGETITEMFFASDFPGAPVEMRTTQDNELLMEMYQLERNRPN